jgi:hypothetical protein
MIPPRYQGREGFALVIYYDNPGLVGDPTILATNRLNWEAKRIIMAYTLLQLSSLDKSLKRWARSNRETIGSRHLFSRDSSILHP